MPHSPRKQKSPSAAAWPPVNFRVSEQAQRGIRAEAKNLQLTLGEYIVQLYAFGKAHRFPARVAPAAHRPVRKTFLVRMPPDIATKMHVNIARRDMKLGDFTEQLFAFGRENTFLAWLDSYDPEK